MKSLWHSLTTYLLFFICVTQPLSAALIFWDNSSGDGLWHTPANWSGNTVPSLNDDVIIDITDTITITSSTEISSLAIGKSDGSVATVLNFDYDALTQGPLIISGNDLIVYPNSTITHQGGTDIVARIVLSIPSGEVLIYGAISADAKGFSGGSSSSDGWGPGGGDGVNRTYKKAGGGAYGGFGGNGGAVTTLGGEPYGSHTYPASYGSGGGAAATVPGGKGGGVIHINSAQDIYLYGRISAEGESTGSNGGGGAGGSIYINSDYFTGTGTVSVASGSSNGTGGGSGGRAAIFIASNTFNGTIINQGKGNAEPGTAIIVDTTYSDLYIMLSQIWRTTPASEGITQSYRNVYIQNSSTLSLENYVINETNGYGVVFDVQSFYLPTGCFVHANGGGFPGGIASSNGWGHGGGTGIDKYYKLAGGGAYGGYAADGGVAGGTPFGCATNPVFLGSGGGAAGDDPGCAGGGAIIILADDEINIDGTLSVNGASTIENSGAGAGGSIYLSAHTLSGNGILSAVGGLSGGAGHGSGGRAVLYYSSNIFAGSISNTIPSTTAEPGTFLFIDKTVTDLYVNITQILRADPIYDGATQYFRNIFVDNSSTLSLTSCIQNQSNGYGFVFFVDSFNVATGSDVHADGLGFPGGTESNKGWGPGGGNGTSYSSYRATGGAHGGAGGSGMFPASVPYGSRVLPGTLGCGGGAAGNDKGGNGGGSIQIFAEKEICINGQLSAKGESTDTFAGGGAGGTILLDTVHLTGNGTISYEGGISGETGHGGGGRGAFYLDSNTFSGTIVNTGEYTAENGTSLTFDALTSNVYINASQVWHAAPSCGNPTQFLESVFVDNSSTLRIISHVVDTNNGYGMVLYVTSLLINTGSVVHADYAGFHGGTSDNDGWGPGGGEFSSFATYKAGGGAYGGNGGDSGNYTPAGGIIYGTNIYPRYLGSGGGGAGTDTGGAGGGAIEIYSQGNIVINGTLTANAQSCTNNAGGGAGGSLYLSCIWFSGKGTMTALGGDSLGGAGGGGRIAVYSLTNTWEGSSLKITDATAGGTGDLSGEPGTVYLHVPIIPEPPLIIFTLFVYPLIYKRRSSST